MLQKFAEIFTEKSIQNNVISIEDRELYIFAYRMLISKFITWGTVILIGAILNSLIGVALFMIYFIPLRIYAGGYHAKSAFHCYIGSTILFVSVLITCLYLSNTINNLVLSLTLLISSEIIWFLSPIGDANKPLDDNEKIKYKQKSRLILVIEDISILFMMRLNLNPLYIMFCLISIVTISILLLMAKIYAYYKKEDSI